MKIRVEADLAEMEDYYGQTLDEIVTDEVAGMLRREVKARLKADRAKIQVLLDKATDAQLEKMRKELEKLIK